jgi:hypothetical protein
MVPARNASGAPDYLLLIPRGHIGTAIALKVEMSKFQAQGFGPGLDPGAIARRFDHLRPVSFDELGRAAGKPVFPREKPRPRGL